MFVKFIAKFFCNYQTKEQIRFLESLNRMQYKNDEQLIANIRSIYSHRVPLPNLVIFRGMLSSVEYDKQHRELSTKKFQMLSGLSTVLL